VDGSRVFRSLTAWGKKLLQNLAELVLMMRCGVWEGSFTMEEALHASECVTTQNSQ